MHELNPSKPCHCEVCMGDRYWSPCDGCSAGHSSFWRTVITSEYWQGWIEENEVRRHMRPMGDCYDIDECMECGWISAKHFDAFIKYIIKDYAS